MYATEAVQVEEVGTTGVGPPTTIGGVSCCRGGASYCRDGLSCCTDGVGETRIPGAGAGPSVQGWSLLVQRAGFKLYMYDI